MKVLCTSVPDKWYEYIEKKAKENGMSVSNFVRSFIIMEWFKERGVLNEDE